MEYRYLFKGIFLCESMHSIKMVENEKKDNENGRLF
jgi:hypothetical protein